MSSTPLVSQHWHQRSSGFPQNVLLAAAEDSLGQRYSAASIRRLSEKTIDPSFLKRRID